MIKRFFAAASAVMILWSMTRQVDQIEIKPLHDFDLAPGPWFQAYLFDWMKAHGTLDPNDATSGIAKGAASGDFIWATATPEWDRDWFHAHGWRFPPKWVPFQYLATSEGEPGDACTLRGL